MNVELGYLSELLKLAGPMKGVKSATDPVAEARPVLRLLHLVGKSKRRDRRPTPDELQRLREHFRAAAWRSTIPMVDIIDSAILTAKRESEITRLLWSDVDQVNRTALLRDAKHPTRRPATTSDPAPGRGMGHRAAPAQTGCRRTDLPLQLQFRRHGLHSRLREAADRRSVPP